MNPQTARRLMCAAVLLAGCTAPKKPPTTGPTTPPSPKMTVTLNQPGNGPSVPALIHLDVYQFDVPVGSISNNDQFWAHVNELRVGDGTPTKDLLARNGLRSGVAMKDDWAYFGGILNRLPDRTRKTTITKTRVDLMQLDLDKPAESEDIFVFDMANREEGRTYEGCVNTIDLAFQPAPQLPGGTRIALCPVVTAHRHRMQYTAMNQEYESPFEDAYRFYGMNLISDVDSSEFLIVSPGPGVVRSSSLGAQFLVNKDNVEHLEQVLVIVPTYLQMDGKPITITDTAIGH